MRKTVLSFLFPLLFCAFASSAAFAESIPAHLASMAATLYRDAAKTLDDSNLPPAQKVAAARTIEALKRARIGSWARRKVTLPDAGTKLAKALDLDLSKPADLEEMSKLLAMNEDAARKVLNARFPDGTMLNEVLNALSAARKPGDGMATSHVIQFGHGESLELDWQPESGKFLIRSRDDGKHAGKPYEGVLIGDAMLSPDPETGGLDVGVKPAQQPLRILSEQDLVRIRKSIFGDWTTKEGEHWIFAPANGNANAGDIRRERADIERDIKKAEDEIRAIKSAKAYLWVDEKAGRTIRQKRFRRLDDPWVYKGEKNVDPDAEKKIAKLNDELSTLKTELSGAALPPVQQHDPVEFEAAQRDGAQPISATVKRPNGYSYTWDEASFDGRRVRGRRTYRDERDINQNIPLAIRNQLAASWAPPGWFAFEAHIDLATGKIGLAGQRWALHVTYTMGDIYGGGPEVESIHTPFPIEIAMVQAGSNTKSAWGAADNALP